MSRAMTVGAIVAEDDSPGSIRAYFEPVEEVATLPSLSNPVGGRQHFIDLDGEGRQFLMQFPSGALHWRAVVMASICTVTRSSLVHERTPSLSIL
jgi:hypothetical protein